MSEGTAIAFDGEPFDFAAWEEAAMPKGIGIARSGKDEFLAVRVVLVDNDGPIELANLRPSDPEGPLTLLQLLVYLLRAGVSLHPKSVPRKTLLAFADEYASEVAYSMAYVSAESLIESARMNSRPRPRR